MIHGYSWLLIDLHCSIQNCAKGGERKTKNEKRTELRQSGEWGGQIAAAIMLIRSPLLHLRNVVELSDTTYVIVHLPYHIHLSLSE